MHQRTRGECPAERDIIDSLILRAHSLDKAACMFQTRHGGEQLAVMVAAKVGNSATVVSPAHPTETAGSLQPLDERVDVVIRKLTREQLVSGLEALGRQADIQPLDSCGTLVAEHDQVGVVGKGTVT